MQGKILMNKDCEKYKNLILSQLENNWEREILVPEHVKNCLSCSNFYNDIQKIQNDLELLGSLIKENIPEIDIRENIKDELKKIKRGETVVREIVEREDSIPEFIEWHAFIENELDEVARYRCE